MITTHLLSVNLGVEEFKTMVHIVPLRHQEIIQSPTFVQWTLLLPLRPERVLDTVRVQMAVSVCEATVKESFD